MAIQKNHPKVTEAYDNAKECNYVGVEGFFLGEVIAQAKWIQAQIEGHVNEKISFETALILAAKSVEYNFFDSVFYELDHDSKIDYIVDYLESIDKKYNVL
jgi:hypothetical protein